MKTVYEFPKAELVKLSESDVLRTSGDGTTVTLNGTQVGDATTMTYAWGGLTREQ